MASKESKLNKTVRRSLTLGVAFSVLCVLAGCGGSNPTNPSPPPSPTPVSGTPGGTTLPNGSMSARIDGSVWNASAGITAVYSAVNNREALVAISGGDSAGQVVALATIATGPGTYTTGSTVGANFNTAQLLRRWVASALDGGTGTVTFTTLTSARATGTFSFTAVASPGTGATGTKTVTEGAFNVTF
jgi:hypothetical protein